MTVIISLILIKNRHKYVYHAFRMMDYQAAKSVRIINIARLAQLDMLIKEGVVFIMNVKKEFMIWQNRNAHKFALKILSLVILKIYVYSN